MKKGPKTSFSYMPEYKVWSEMVQRTTNAKCKAWVNYGGRGIRVCERWLKFENFLADMGQRPDGFTLERTDNDGPYAQHNCILASRADQSKNTRRRSDNKTGVRGVHFCKLRRKFKAEIRTNGTTKRLGSYDTLDDAAAARRAAELLYWGKNV